MQLGQTFNEICKVSAVKATSALSKFLQIPIGVNIKHAEIQELDDIHMFNNPEEPTVNIYLPITGDLAGGSFFLFTTSSALALCDVLFHRKEGTTKDFNEDEISALSEVANIVIGNFLSSFSQSMQMNFLMHRAGVFDCGPFSRTIEPNLAGLKEKMGEVVVKISFGFEHINIRGYVLIVFDEERIKNIMKNLTPIL